MMTSFKVAKWNLEKLLLYTGSGEPVKKMLCVWNIDIKEGGGGTSASKTVAENERQVSQVSGERKSEISFGQSASRRGSESGPAPSASTRPGLSSPSSSISSLPSSEKSILNPNAKVYFFYLICFKFFVVFTNQKSLGLIRNSNHRNHQLLYGLNLQLQVAHSTTLLQLHRFSRCL